MRKLIFVDDLLKEAEQIVAEEKPDVISFLSENDMSNTIIELLDGSNHQAQCVSISESFEQEPGKKHLFIIPHTGADEVSDGLMQFVDRQNIVILAQKTDRYYLNKSLFLVSIPKAGTHLLYRLADIFGFSSGMTFKDFARPGLWYCLEYSNSHTKAKDFFIDSVRRSPFGNRQHPFINSPVLFIYRNPLDILVSEANYYHINDNTLFSGYFYNTTFEERVDLLINDPHLLGSIRDRINEFVPWLRFPNVIPLSFEELVGTKGDGSDALQNDLIWSLQLKLQIPGDAKNFVQGLYDTSSPTFSRGKIGQYRHLLTKDQFSRISELDQDFIEALGYKGLGPESEIFFSQRVEEFRCRPLTYVKQSHKDTPVLIETELFGYNIIKYGKRYYAYPCGEKVDIREHLHDHGPESILSDPALENLKYTVAYMVLIEHAIPNTNNMVLLRIQEYVKLTTKINKLQKGIEALKDSILKHEQIEEHQEYGGQIIELRKKLAEIEMKMVCKPKLIWKNNSKV